MFRNASSVLFKVLAQIINKYSDSAGEVMPLWKYGNSVTVIKDTPVQFIDQLNKFLVQELAKQDFKDKLIAAGAEPVNISPAESNKFITAEANRWQDLIKKSSIKVDN